MKQYKNILFSVVSIILAFILLFSFHLRDTKYFFVFYIFVILGIFFAYKNQREHKSSLIAKLLLVISILSLFYQFLELPIAFVLSNLLFKITH